MKVKAALTCDKSGVDISAGVAKPVAVDQLESPWVRKAVISEGVTDVEGILSVCVLMALAVVWRAERLAAVARPEISTVCVVTLTVSVVVVS